MEEEYKDAMRKLIKEFTGALPLTSTDYPTDQGFKDYCIENTAAFKMFGIEVTFSNGVLDICTRDSEGGLLKEIYIDKDKVVGSGWNIRRNKVKGQ